MAKYEGGGGGGGSSLPAVSNADNGDNLSVVGGVWAKAFNAFRSVATIAARNALTATGIVTAGMLAYVGTTKCLYVLNSDLTTWSFFAPSPELLKQAAWAVDIATGSDNNSGLPGSPIATSEELSRRLSPDGAIGVINQNTTVSFASGTYGRLILNLGAPVNSGFTFIISCAFTSTADMPLTGVVNTNSATLVRGQLTVSSGAFVNKSRIRSTSGANIGAIAYSSGQTAGAVDTNHFVSQFFNYATFGTPNIANGTNVVVDTLTVSFAEVELGFLSGNNLTSGFFELHDAKILRGATVQATDSNPINLVGCELTGNFYGNILFASCRSLGACSHYLGTQNFYGCCQQTNNVAAWEGSNLQYFAGNSFDGAGLLARNNSYIAFANASEWENGAGGIALEAVNAGSVVIGAKQWGNAAAPGSAYAGWVVLNGSDMSTGSTSFLAIPVTTAAAAVQVCGTSYAVGEVPICIAEQSATFSLALAAGVQDTGGVGSTAKSIYLTAAARGNVPSTLLATAPRKGGYEAWAYLSPTVAGTLGTDVQVNIIYKDDGGTTRTVPILLHGPGATGGVDITTLNGFGGSTTIETDGVANVNYSVTGVTTQGSLQYSLRVGIRIRSPG